MMPTASPTLDPFGRAIRYLRVSITDRCNLRCVYCMPSEGVPALAHEAILRYEEIARLVRVAVDLGLREVRLTGGEPLARKGVVELVAQLAAIPGLEGLALTTNGTLLAPLAEALKRAGLQRVNISLDSLDAERYRALTRGGALSAALEGIAAAQRAGLEPVKINMVVMRGVNDDEVEALAAATVGHGWHVRYIEVMPLGEHPLLARQQFVSAEAVRKRIEGRWGALEPADLPGNGPAETWRIAGAAGTIGFIGALSHSFCGACNRLRLTADGRLIPCLMANTALDVRGPLRSGADDETLRALLLEAIAQKGAGHQLDRHVATASHAMSRIGG